MKSIGSWSGVAIVARNHTVKEEKSCQLRCVVWILHYSKCPKSRRLMMTELTLDCRASFNFRS